MSEIFFKKKFLVSERTGLTSMEESYQILDPDTGEAMLYAAEESSPAIRVLKFFLDKSFLPCVIKVRKSNGLPLLDLYQGAGLFPGIEARLSDGKVLCRFRKKLGSFFSCLDMSDGQGQPLGMLKGDWKNRVFNYFDTNQNKVGTIRHLYAGLSRELFTTTDDYEVEIFGDNSQSLVMLAATLSVDTLYHEG